MTRKTWAVIGVTALVLFGLDQLTKQLAESVYLVADSPDNFREYRVTYAELIGIGEVSTPSQHNENGTYLRMGLTYLRNPGFGWSAMGDLPETIRRPFFLLVSALPLIFIAIYLLKSRDPTPQTKWVSALIVAGALGNLADRARLGYVIDMISMDWNLFGWAYKFPVFNVADIWIFIGFCGLLFLPTINALQAKKA